MVGLELNHAKCELVHSSLKVDEMLNSSHSNSYAIVHQCSDLSVGEDLKICQFPLTVPEEACLLEAPVLMGPAMDKILAKRCTKLDFFRGVARGTGGEPPRAPGWGGANEANN